MILQRPDGLTYYQIEVILVAARAVRERIEKVEYFMADMWPEEFRKQVITDRNTRFKMKELALRTSIVRGEVWTKEAKHPVILNRFIDLRPDGPRI